ncbi:MAG: hypothetical protein EXX96DRAFT_475890 [Benjaminiella poitrasii]|nr:MAG: hypothetical protein EXX96DRAFT_475890 [Benjaminiella poitrasii]
MPSTKYHLFEEKNFQGLVYCDYCGKLLWGLARQGFQCTECGYNCHVECSDMVIQCRPVRRTSPDTLSVTDSEAESVISRYSHRNSLERFNSTSSLDDSRTRTPNEPLKSPVFPSSKDSNNSNSNAKQYSYRQSLTQRLQRRTNHGEISPHAIAKAFTRWTASDVLLPRYDEQSPEYHRNMQDMQQAFVFLIHLYDNLAYHLQHVRLTSTTYKVLAVTSVAISGVLAYVGLGPFMMVVGLIVLVNRTWIGKVLEAVLGFLWETLQTIIGLCQKISRKSVKEIQRKSIQVSVYENQRWWTGTGYTSQLLRSERSAWSNLSGSEPLPSKDEMPPPMNYSWEDTDWHLDKTGPWIDEALGIIGNLSKERIFFYVNCMHYADVPFFFLSIC